MKRPELLLAFFGVLLLNVIGTGQARPIRPLNSGNQPETGNVFPWYAIVIAVAGVPLLIFLMYECSQTQTIFKQCTKSEGNESG